MKNIRSTEELRDAILQLENRQIIQEQLIKEQFYLVYSSLTPVNIIKNTLKGVISSPEIKNNIIDYVANFVADFVSKQLVKEKSGNYFKKYLRQIVHFGITSIITLNSDNIRSMIESIVHKFTKGNNEHDTD